MSDSADEVMERPDGATLAVATPDEDERLRALIRAELDRRYALPVARRTLELIVETAAEPAVGSPGYRIVDRNGETRLRPVESETPAKAKSRKPRKGDKPVEAPPAPTVPMTLPELVEELRTQHPDLFGAPPPEPEPPPPPPEHHASVGETVAHVRAAGAKFVETQTALAKSLAASSAEHGRAFATAASETVEGWRHQLDEKLKTHRTAETESAAPDAALPAAAPAAAAPATLSAPVQASQPRRAWGSFGRDAGMRLRAGGEAFRARLRRRPEAAPAGPAVPRLVPTLREVTSDLLRRRLMVVGLGGATVLAVAFAAFVLTRDNGTGTATESPVPDKPSQQAEATPPAQPPVAQEPAPPQTAAPTSPSADPEEQPDEPKRADPNAVAGVPEVIDTATLRISGKLVRLFGVEWVRGGQSDELTKYLAGRSVTCKAAPGSSAYLCTVNGRDLSEVVLFNGGGRASPEATPDLVAAEDRARTERIGVWKR